MSKQFGEVKKVRKISPGWDPIIQQIRRLRKHIHLFQATSMQVSLLVEMDWKQGHNTNGYVSQTPFLEVFRRVGKHEDISQQTIANLPATLQAKHPAWFAGSQKWLSQSLTASKCAYIKYNACMYRELGSCQKKCNSEYWRLITVP